MATGGPWKVGGLSGAQLGQRAKGYCRKSAGSHEQQRLLVSGLPVAGASWIRETRACAQVPSETELPAEQRPEVVTTPLGAAQCRVGLSACRWDPIRCWAA